MSRMGKVFLVGAGPGDVELLTIKGKRLLEQAEVVVYDRLVDEGVLSFVRPGAEMIFVGKGRGEKVMPQEEINALLVEKGRQGKVVVRLKGGDPFVLGRGGEEAEALALAGIPFEVVPGVTAAVAVPAYAGIPVTHRSLASSFAVVTGHEDPERGESRIAWEKLATGADTLVFLMGRENLASICYNLVQHGRAPNTPVCLIRWGTLPRQQTLVGTLEDIAGGADAVGFAPPVVAIIGSVVSLREKLRWFDTRPLFGQRVLVTRSRSQASILSHLLAQQGAQVIELPTISIEPLPKATQLDNALSRLPEFDWLVFTSPNGVQAFFARLFELGQDVRSLGRCHICAIGPATAEALKSYGLIADLIPQDFSSKGIIHSFQPYNVAGARFLLPRADLAGQELVEALEGMGGKVEQVVTYRTIPAQQGQAAARELFQAGIDIVTFTSASTVKGLARLLDGDTEILKGSQIACIGPITAAAVERLGLPVAVIAQEHTIPGLVKAMVERFGKK